MFQASPSLDQVRMVLVDARNIEEYRDHLQQCCTQGGGYIGFDVESYQEPHEGLVKFMKIDDEGFHKGKKLVFDHRRSVITGASFYFGKVDPYRVYYLNFFHADVENRIPHDFLKKLLDATKQNNQNLIIHNAAYEIAVHLASLKQDITNYLCSMQLLVSAYGPDEYPISKLQAALVQGVRTILPEINRDFEDVENANDLSPKQYKTLNKFIGKTSDSSWSYNGIVKSISYGYGLKTAVKSWFNHQMDDFKKTLGTKPNMAALTGEEVLSYGCEDAYWCYQLFMQTLAWLVKRNKPVIQTYLMQENPMCHVFGELWQQGMSVNLPAIYERRETNRVEIATLLLKFKNLLREAMSHELKYNQDLAKYDSGWYKPASHEKYYGLIQSWLSQPDDVSDFDLCTQVKCATGNAWYEDLNGAGAKTPAKLSLNHYMAMRYILHVVFGLPVKVEKGKVQSDAEARDEMGDHPILELYKRLGMIEQAMKLYVTPYILLTDPETLRMYPVLSSTLATRRTAGQHPNPQQLSKYSETAYVRSYYQADNPDHLIVSLDWSAVELVLIGEFSGDPEFAKAYGQLPHEDLHSAAAAGCMDMDLIEFHKHPDSKELRKNVGKGANFGYWYSGWLGTTAKNMGWDLERTKRAVDGYISRFYVGEQWRLGVIEEVCRKGFVELPDHHRRVRFEATERWAEIIRDVFDSFGSTAANNFARIAIRKIQQRAGNQAVNAMIQGSCATLAKRAILSMLNVLKEKAYDARFLCLIHDEVLFSVHKDHCIEVMDLLYGEMIQGRGVINDLKLDSSIAIGYTFQPYHPVKAPYGQIELMEMPKGLPCIPESRWGQRATDTERQQIVDYLSSRP